jgi:AcrR family transcriptional regulator
VGTVRLAEVVRVLPRRAHDLPRGTVRESQRWRLIEAIAEAVAKHGYASASVADAIAIAGVSRKTFYEHFHDKEDCFLAAFEAISNRLLERVAAAGASYPAGPARRRAQLERFLEGLARDPLGARVFLVDATAASPQALRTCQQIDARFGEVLLGDTANGVGRVAITGGINRAVVAELIARGPAHLPALIDDLAAFVERALPKPTRSPLNTPII